MSETITPRLDRTITRRQAEEEAEQVRRQRAFATETNRQVGARAAIVDWQRANREVPNRSLADLVATLAAIAACPACLSEQHVLHV